MGGRDLDSLHNPGVPEPTEEKRKQAMLAICTYAANADDARYLIDMLALR